MNIISLAELGIHQVRQAEDVIECHIFLYLIVEII